MQSFFYLLIEGSDGNSEANPNVSGDAETGTNYSICSSTRDFVDPDTSLDGNPQLLYIKIWNEKFAYASTHPPKPFLVSMFKVILEFKATLLQFIIFLNFLEFPLTLEQPQIA